MTPSTFITGSSGFVGRHLLRRLPAELAQSCICLVRSRPAAAEWRDKPVPRFVLGDVLDDDSYAPYLEQADMVLHLAAATGKATPEEHHATNAEGTALLVEQCSLKGIKRFVLLSTIAVKYPSAASYPYAASKLRAEEAVRSNITEHLILRPTVIVGRGNPPWESLLALASKPVLFLPGDGRVVVQPIHVDDLVDGLLAILEGKLFLRGTFELGGPDRLSLEEFVRRIHRGYHGRDVRVVKLPLAPLLSFLRAAERVSPSLLPFTAAQLSFFAHSSIVDEQGNELYRRLRPGMKDVDQMISAAIDE